MKTIYEKFTVWSLVPFALAQGGESTGGVIELAPKTGLASTLTDLSISGIVSAGVRLLLVIASIAFFFYLVWGGIRWIMSGGDKAQTETARNQITSALIGLVIVFAAWAILQLLATFFGINILENLTLPKAQN